LSISIGSIKSYHNNTTGSILIRASFYDARQ